MAVMRPAWLKKYEQNIEDQITVIGQSPSNGNEGSRGRGVRPRAPLSTSTGAGPDGQVQPSEPTTVELLEKHEGEEVVSNKTVNQLGGNEAVKRILVKELRKKGENVTISDFRRGGTIKKINGGNVHKFQFAGTIPRAGATTGAGQDFLQNPNLQTQNLTDFSTFGQTAPKDETVPIETIDTLGTSTIKQPVVTPPVTSTIDTLTPPALQTGTAGAAATTNLPPRPVIDAKTFRETGGTPGSATFDDFVKDITKVDIIDPLKDLKPIGEAPTEKVAAEVPADAVTTAADLETDDIDTAAANAADSEQPIITLPDTPSSIQTINNPTIRNAIRQTQLQASGQSILAETLSNVGFQQLDAGAQTQLTIAAMNIANNPNVTDGAKLTMMAETMRNAGIQRSDFAAKLAIDNMSRAEAAVDRVFQMAVADRTFDFNAKVNERNFNYLQSTEKVKFDYGVALDTAKIKIAAGDFVGANEAFAPLGFTVDFSKPINAAKQKSMADGLGNLSSRIFQGAAFEDPLVQGDLAQVWEAMNGEGSATGSEFDEWARNEYDTAKIKQHPIWGPLSALDDSDIELLLRNNLSADENADFDIEDFEHAGKTGAEAGRLSLGTLMINKGLKIGKDGLELDPDASGLDVLLGIKTGDDITTLTFDITTDEPFGKGADDVLEAGREANPEAFDDVVKARSKEIIDQADLSSLRGLEAGDPVFDEVLKAATIIQEGPTGVDVERHTFKNDQFRFKTAPVQGSIINVGGKLFKVTSGVKTFKENIKGTTSDFIIQFVEVIDATTGVPTRMKVTSSGVFIE